MPAGELRAAGARRRSTTTCQRAPTAARGCVRPGVGLVAGVDADQQRGQRLGDARHLQAPAVHAAQSVDAVDQLRAPALVGLARRRRPARPGRARARGRRSDAALTVCSAETTRTPSGTISRACWAAEPCHTPSIRVALPATAAASGTVASMNSWPSRRRPSRLVRVSDWLRKGTLRMTVAAAPAAPALSWPLNWPLGHQHARTRSTVSRRGRVAEPIAIGTPVRASRRPGRSRARRRRRSPRRVWARRDTGAEYRLRG